MAGVKFAAHPLVVAVAMGLLSPAALVEGPSMDGGEGLDLASAMRTEALVANDAEALAAMLEEDGAPSAEDLARVEAEWHEVRNLI